MFCIHCGNQLNDGVKFCPNCGKSADVTFSEPAMQELKFEQSDIPQKENKCAYLSNLFGKLALIFCWFLPATILAEAAIALGIVGICLKNKFPKNSELAKKGLIKGIIATAIGIVLVVIVYVIYFVVLMIIASTPPDTTMAIFNLV